MLLRASFGSGGTLVKMPQIKAYSMKFSTNEM